jgi:hypothetical protein
LILSVVIAAAFIAPAAAAPTTTSFSNIPLIVQNGSSEPAVAIDANGDVVFSALSWQLFQTNIWTASFGTTPVFQGAPDISIGKGIGGEDADIDIGSTGTLHITTLMDFPSPNFLGQLGVSSITCPNGDTSDDFAHCTAQILDHTQADRPWVTSDGNVVYISYHDSGSSTGIKVWRSMDDGITWMKVGDPIVAQGGFTSISTFDNDQGKIIADPSTHSVFAVYAAGQGGLQKAKNAFFNNIVVSRSTDMGRSWTPSLVFHAPVNTALNNVFPALAIDPVNGNLYASWSDAHNVSMASSSDHGATWSSPVRINTGDAVTAVLPAIAAYNHHVDLAYYSTKAGSKDDPAAVWNATMALSTDDGAHFTQVTVSAHLNHVGVICTFGTGCARGTRNLLDLFQVAINPKSAKAAVIFVDDTLTTYTRRDGTIAKLPQVIVAWES